MSGNTPELPLSLTGVCRAPREWGARQGVAYLAIIFAAFTG